MPIPRAELIAQKWKKTGRRKRLHEVRSDVEQALLVLRCSTDPSLSAVKTMAEAQIEIINALLKRE